jgi:hypothetical protein
MEIIFAVFADSVIREGIGKLVANSQKLLLKVQGD